VSELLFENAVDEAELLLFLQLKTIFGDLSSHSCVGISEFKVIGNASLAQLVELCLSFGSKSSAYAHYHGADAEFAASIKCFVAGSKVVCSVKRVVVEKSGTEMVDESTESKAGVPGGGEVGDVDAFIALGILLAPKKKCITCSLLFNGNVFDLEFVNAGPCETESHFEISVVNVGVVDTDKFDSFDVCDVINGSCAVFNGFVSLSDALLNFFVPLHLDWFFADDFKKIAEFDTIPEIGFNRFELNAPLLEVLSAPTGENFDLGLFPIAVV